MYKVWKPIVLGAVALTWQTVSAQQECFCAPLVYRWTLDFSKTCDFSSVGASGDIIGINVGEEFGVRDANCEVDVESDDSSRVDSNVPVTVTRVIIQELDDASLKLKEISFGQTLGDGAMIEYSSAKILPGSVNPEALLAIIYARNAYGEEISLQWIVRFSNLCEVLPFKDGDNLGWMVFVSVFF